MSTQILETELAHLRAIKQLHENLINLHQSKTIREDILRELKTLLACSNLLLLDYNAEDASLEYIAAFPKPTKKPSIFINTFNAADASFVKRIAAGESIVFDSPIEDERLASLAEFIQAQHGIMLPLQTGANLLGLLIAYNNPDSPLNPDTEKLLQALLPSIISLLQLVKKQDLTQSRLENIERETEIFSRIDAELADIIDLNYVFTMMKDWALRFTNAAAAALCLYDHLADNLRIMSHYGFKVGTFKDGQDLSTVQGGIMLRVARSGRAEIVPDVSIDADYYEMAAGVRTQMSVPIMREDKVIGVLSLLSRELNGFHDEHLEFAKRLSSRAGVAVDNARLFTETTREREKLSYIVQNIGDNIIVLGLDNRILMINDAAIQALHLSKETEFIGKAFTDVVSHQKLQSAYQDAVENQETHTSEIELPNGRVYYTKIEYHQSVGRIIVMQDITFFKEADKLKTELISTVSHDLKQPLSVMRGYLDLLQMVNDFDTKSVAYVDNLNYAFTNMRQLIDDLLDTARIEAGVTLDLEQVNLVDVLNRAIRNNQPQAEQKNIKLVLELPTELPSVSADPARLEQIFNNLVSNGVKYTRPEGTVRVYADIKQDIVRIFVEDNGLGISAEDQAQIFERFFRVRRPETDSIEGTGLGLAIVKSLVEAHQGKIDIKSALGEGSTFRVSLPTH